MYFQWRNFASPGVERAKQAAQEADRKAQARNQKVVNQSTHEELAPVISEAEQSLMSQMKHFTKKLEKEQAANRQLKNEQSSKFFNSQELEHFFLSCVNDSRKSCDKRKAGISQGAKGLSGSPDKGAYLARLLTSLVQGNTSPDRQHLDSFIESEEVMTCLHGSLFPRQGWRKIHEIFG